MRHRLRVYKLWLPKKHDQQVFLASKCFLLFLLDLDFSASLSYKTYNGIRRLNFCAVGSIVKNFDKGSIEQFLDYIVFLTFTKYYDFAFM